MNCPKSYKKFKQKQTSFEKLFLRSNLGFPPVFIMTIFFATLENNLKID